MAMELSKSIREIRDIQSLSQEGLARILGVSVRTIARWESGESRPSPLALEKLQQTIMHQSKEAGAHVSSR